MDVSRQVNDSTKYTSHYIEPNQNHPLAIDNIIRLINSWLYVPRPFTWHYISQWGQTLPSSAESDIKYSQPLIDECGNVGHIVYAKISFKAASSGKQFLVK